MGTQFTRSVWKRGVVLRGYLGILLVVLGGIFLMYGYTGSEIVVTTKDEFSIFATVGTAASERSPAEDLLVMFDVRSPERTRTMAPHARTTGSGDSCARFAPASGRAGR